MAFTLAPHHSFLVLLRCEDCMACARLLLYDILPHCLVVVFAQITCTSKENILPALAENTQVLLETTGKYPIGKTKRWLSLSLLGSPIFMVKAKVSEP